MFRGSTNIEERGKRNIFGVLRSKRTGFAGRKTPFPPFIYAHPRSEWVTTGEGRFYFTVLDASTGIVVDDDA